MISNRFKYKLFGRFKGRKKIDSLLIKTLKKHSFNIKNGINSKSYNILDIGSGSGENAIFLSKLNNQPNIITCDLYQDGNINLCNEIIKKNIKNISLYQGNVLELLDCLEKKSVFDEIWILFPDPWPKIRHHKRRLINTSFLKYISFFLKNSGKLMLATDSKSYIHSIIQSIYETQKILDWENQQYQLWEYRYLNLPRTRFYNKSLKSDKNSMFFRLKKI